MKKLFYAFFVFVMVMCVTIKSEASIIVADAVASSYWSTMPVSRIVDGSGLNTANDPATHISTDWGSSWETMPYLYSAVVTFDFEGNYDVGSVRVWNFNLLNANGPYMGRGAKDVVISTSSNGATWLNRGSYVFDRAPGLDTYTGQLFSNLNWQDTRYVEFNIQNIWGDGDTGGHAGLSEVQFYTPDASPDSVVPEPASLSLLVLGLSGLLFRRKRIA